MIKLLLFVSLLVCTIFVLALWNIALHIEVEARNKDLIRHQILYKLCKPAHVLKKPTYEFAPTSTTTPNK